MSRRPTATRQSRKVLEKAAPSSCDEQWFQELTASTNDPNKVAEALLERFDRLFSHLALAFARGDDEVARDLRQNYLLRLVKKLHDKINLGFRGGKLKPFLTKAFRNACIDWYRKHWSAPPLQLDFSETVPDPNSEQLQREAKDLREKIREAVDCLPEIDREVVRLRDYEGWDYQQIAAAIGRKVEAVRQIHHRALKKLQMRLEQLRNEFVG